MCDPCRYFLTPPGSSWLLLVTPGKNPHPANCSQETVAAGIRAFSAALAFQQPAEEPEGGARKKAKSTRENGRARGYPPLGISGSSCPPLFSLFPGLLGSLIGSTVKELALAAETHFVEKILNSILDIFLLQVYSALTSPPAPYQNLTRTLPEPHQNPIRNLLDPYQNLTKASPERHQNPYKNLTRSHQNPTITNQNLTRNLPEPH